ncbi:MAG TPA: Ig-like domain-containing protein [Solirubrobacterales bacterium]|nr:Ig-like domain-containing protein [Solirubrobacterales bacterium]
MALAAVPSSAGAYIFWVDGSGSIGRAHLDGSDVESQFISAPGTIELARSGNHLYFSHTGFEYPVIGRVDLDGANLDTAFVGGYAQTLPYAVAADAGHIYWSSYSGWAEIGRANSDGSVTDFAFTGIPGRPARMTNLAVDGSHIYWSTENWIGRANIDGTGVDNFFIAGTHVRGIAVQGGYIYWGNTETNQIGRANLDGTGVNQSFIATTGTPEGVAADADHLYWSNTGQGSIGRANLDGTGVDNSFITGTQVSRGIIVAAEPPTLTLDSGPTGTTTDATPTFGFTAEAGTTVTCSIDQGVESPAPCSGAGTDTSGTPLPDGAYTFRVRATNAGAVDTVRTREFTVDTTPPETTIGSGPPTGPSNTLAPTFSFSASEGGSSFECDLDNAGWSSCPSPQTYNGLADGEHSFEVRAVDAVGNTDPTPASRSFSLDTTAPDTTIDAVEEIGEWTYFNFSASEPGATFECNFEKSSWHPCQSPNNGLFLIGEHSFEVRAVDAVGNADKTPATWTATFDPYPETTIDTGPQGQTAGDDATFAFSSSKDGSTFRCNLDNAGWSACASPQSFSGLAAGDHLFEVFAVGPSGWGDETPASRAFTVVPQTEIVAQTEPGPPAMTAAAPPAVVSTQRDSQPPITQFTTKPKAKTKTRNKAVKVKVSFSSEAGARFECRLDKAAFKPCSSPFTVQAKSKSGKGLVHTISVRATDTSGNVGEPEVVGFDVVRLH